LLVGEHNLVSLVASPRAGAGDALSIAVQTDEHFTLIVHRTGRPDASVSVCAGSSTVAVP
jgi:hypothetical protein